MAEFILETDYPSRRIMSEPVSEDVENLKSFLKIRILAITTQITLSSSALHFEKFRKVGKFDKNTLVFLFAKLVQISTVFKEEIQARKSSY